MAYLIAILCAIVHMCQLPPTSVAQDWDSSTSGYFDVSATSGRAGAWIGATGGQLPQGAFVGGHDCDGRRIYVARAKHQWALLPGKLVPSHGCAVPWDGREICKYKYQVLVGGSNNWVRTYGSNVPSGAFPGGETENGEPLYICRVRHDGGCLTTGKMQKSQGVCYIPFGGRELSFRNYEILMR